VDESGWRAPAWLEWLQIAWNAAVGVGMVVLLALAFWDRARPWMAVVVVVAGLPCALLNHIVNTREGRELPPD